MSALVFHGVHLVLAKHPVTNLQHKVLDYGKIKISISYLGLSAPNYNPVVIKVILSVEKKISPLYSGYYEVYNRVVLNCMVIIKH